MPSRPHAVRSTAIVVARKAAARAAVAANAGVGVEAAVVVAAVAVTTPAISTGVTRAIATTNKRGISRSLTRTGPAD
jgi:hypothetical protein